MIKKIGILGCGWLGFPLAQSFVKQGHQVNGSTTSIDKILPLAQNGINPFLIAIHNHHTEGNLEYFLEDLDVLIQPSTVISLFRYFSLSLKISLILGFIISPPKLYKLLYKKPSILEQGRKVYSAVPP